jgi:glycyl-tRNA synthetase beta subunit
LQRYLALATKNNAFQLLAQYEKWHEQSQMKLIDWFKSKEEIQYHNQLKRLETDVKARLHQEDFKGTVKKLKILVTNFAKSPLLFRPRPANE